MTSHNPRTAPPVLAASLVILAVYSTAVSCSGDDPSEPSTAATGGSENEGGEGGANTGGTTTESGGSTASGGDDGGGDPPGAACLACGEADDVCTDVLDTCRAHSECAEYLECLSACSGEQCVQECADEAAPAANLLIHAVNTCLCSECNDSCDEIGSCDATCENLLAPLSGEPPEAPATLLETGLFVDDGNGDWMVADYARPFAPQYELWADGATKERSIYLPECETIDTTDMDHWSFPVGTRVWKTFRVANAQVETRFMHRYGPAAGDWLMISYAWDEAAPDDPSAALPVPDGAASVNGTNHDIPSVGQCTQCHNAQLPEWLLGFSALQLSHADAGQSLGALSAEGRLTVPTPEDGFLVPGDATARAALGYMHANCGHCHHENSFFTGSTPAQMRLLVAHESVEATLAFTTLLNVPTENFNFIAYDRIEPGEPENSAVILRMSNRTAGQQMPPLATKQVDNDGMTAVSAWIESLE